MGYTHYFPQQRAFTDDEWNKLCEAARRIIDYAAQKHGVVVQRDYDDEEKPEINEEHIWLNGVGDEGHETFYITKDKMDGFNFCKTARKPYDIVVGLILLEAENIAQGALEISSDGRWNEGPDDTDYNGDWIHIRKMYLELNDSESDCPWSVTLSDGADILLTESEEDDEEITITVEYQNKVIEHCVSDIKIPKSIQGDEDAIRQYIRDNEFELENVSVEKTWTEESLIDLEVS